MRVYRGETFADVYETALEDVLHFPEFETSPRGMQIREVTDAALVIEDPIECLYENERRSSQFKYIAAELIWYFTGRNDVEFIDKFAKFWKSIDNGDGTVNSAYGNLIFTEKNEHNTNQWQWAYNCLVNDKDSRQAIMHFNKPKHQWEGNKDFVCTLNGIFQIRDNRLHLTIDMRSNDLILGTPTDIPFFCLLQQQMLNLLRETYPDLEMGTYTHIAHSLHIYERHFDLVEDMLDEIFSPMSFPQIGENLVDSTGVPSESVLQIADEIITERDFVRRWDDLLLKWISTAIFTNEFD